MAIYIYIYIKIQGMSNFTKHCTIRVWLVCTAGTDFMLKGSYDGISSFPFSLECYKLFVHR